MSDVKIHETKPSRVTVFHQAQPTTIALPKVSPWIKCFQERVERVRQPGPLAKAQYRWSRVFMWFSALKVKCGRKGRSNQSPALRKLKADGLWLETEANCCCVPTMYQALFQVLLTEGGTRITQNQYSSIQRPWLSEQSVSWSWQNHFNEVSVIPLLF